MKSPLAAAAVVCELCHHHQPSLYCCSDQAFLCLDCDSQVHTANFLVARHIRLPIRISNCNDDDDDSSSTTQTSCNKTSCDWKTRDVLVSWCSRLGVSSRVVEVARHAFQVWWVNRSEWPYRVGLAASLWLAFTKDMKKRKTLMRTLLKRLEEISGVPAKSIVVEQLKLEGVLKRQRQHQRQDEESWAEC